MVERVNLMGSVRVELGVFRQWATEARDRTVMLARCEKKLGDDDVPVEWAIEGAHGRLELFVGDADGKPLDPMMVLDVAPADWERVGAANREDGREMVPVKARFS